MDHPGLQKLIATGGELMFTKYFVHAGLAMVVWDHLITLSDEVKYVWRGAKSWPFWLFIVSRYSVLLCKVWIEITWFWPGYTQEVCDRTVKLEGYYIIFIITLGHVFLMMRVYVLTRAGKYLFVVLGVLITSSFATGLWFVSLPSGKAVKMPNIPLDPFRGCVFISPQTGTVEWAYRLLVALADLIAFIYVVFFVFKLKADCGQSRMTLLMRTVFQDSILYFFVMVWFHIAMVFFTAFGKPSGLPPATMMVLVPVMISRLVLSLRKAADDSLIQVWNEDHFAVVAADEYEMMDFADPPPRRAVFDSYRGPKRSPHLDLPSCVSEV